MRSFAAAVAAMLLTSTAFAADLNGARVDYLPDAPTYELEKQWLTSGPYVGVTAGYSAANIGTEGIDLAGDGFFGGAYLGWSLIANGWMLGVEGDWMLTDIRADNDGSLLTFTAKTNYLASVRARAGIPFGPLLVYGTGGVAFSEAEVAMPGASDTENLFGYVAGGGVEVQVTRTLQIRAEALRYTFDDERFSLGGTSGDVGLDQTMIRVGAGFKLN